MTVRTSQRTVTFRQPFSLSGFDEEFPAGSYSIETDEKLLEGVSIPAYRRISTLIHLQHRAGKSQTLTIDPEELDAALARDKSEAAVPVK